MDIGSAEEQELLQTSARRFLENGEHDPQLYIKRDKASEVALGDATWHRERVARLMTG